ncbi:MAG: class I SAM-dependent methyltransferase, partial [Actinomycetota bacterium]
AGGVDALTIAPGIAHSPASAGDAPAWQSAGAAWGHAAPDWAYGFEPYARDAIETIFNRLDVGPTTHLCDVACGAGYALGRAERLGAMVAGLDASAELLDIASRRAPTAELIAGDMFDLPWADATFDVVTSFNGVWGGCDDALVEARRVLRPGGAIAVTFWGPGDRLDLRDFFITLGRSTPAVGEEMVSLASIGAPGVVEAMLERSGFEQIERFAAPAVLEFTDDDHAWRVLRSPGLVVPALDAVGDKQLRATLLAVLEQFRSDDGSYRLVNELTCVTAQAR